MNILYNYIMDRGRELDKTWATSRPWYIYIYTHMSNVYIYIYITLCVLNCCHLSKLVSKLLSHIKCVWQQKLYITFITPMIYSKMQSPPILMGCGAACLLLSYVYYYYSPSSVATLKGSYGEG